MFPYLRKHLTPYFTKIFEYAIVHHYDEIIDFFIEKHGWTSEFFVFAAQQGDIETLKKIEKKVDVSYNKSQALRLAASNGHEHVVEYLLSVEGIDPNESMAFLAALEKSKFRVAHILLNDPRVDPSLNNNYALELAAPISFCLTKRLLEDERVLVKDLKGALSKTKDINIINLIKSYMKPKILDFKIEGKIVELKIEIP